jgi:hypothetical protein
MSTAIQVHLPDDLVSQAQRHVDEGWAAGFDQLLAEALRRFLETHGPTLSEAFVREDVAWGLHGSD